MQRSFVIRATRGLDLSARAHVEIEIYVYLGFSSTFFHHSEQRRAPRVFSFICDTHAHARDRVNGTDKGLMKKEIWDLPDILGALCVK